MIQSDKIISVLENQHNRNMLTTWW